MDTLWRYYALLTEKRWIRNAWISRMTWTDSPGSYNVTIISTE